MANGRVSPGNLLQMWRVMAVVTQCIYSLARTFTVRKHELCKAIERQIIVIPQTIHWAVKHVLSGHLKIDKTKVLVENGSLMKVKSIAECSPWSILQYF